MNRVIHMNKKRVTLVDAEEDIALLVKEGLEFHNSFIEIYIYQ
ncbi:MAG TPA: hypothetical protein VIY08_00900 [Candidatus Nitrosocosmicus sp.]